MLADLRNRGVHDILIACVDGLKGFPDSIASVFPETTVQLCIVHQIRNSVKYVASKNQKEFMLDLKLVYQAVNKDAAEKALDDFGIKWGKDYPIVIKSWRDNLDRLTAYFQYSQHVRIVKEYREAYNMFCCSGILFNHESERRGETFVTRKITLAAARIAQGKQEKLYLGNLSSLRDWGYAKDYVECMWLILQHDRPEDFVIATGVQHSVREFCHLAFRYAGIELAFQGEGENEKGVCVSGPEHLVGKTLVEVSPDFYRPTDVVNLWGDPTKAKAELGWDPGKTSFEELVRIMVEADMAKVAVERAGDHVRTNLAEYLEKGIVK